MGNMLKKLVSLEEAIDVLSKALSETVQLGVERARLVDACGRALAEDLIATEDRPQWDSSAVDGYAIKGEETTGASHYNPVEFRVIGLLRPGDSPSKFDVDTGMAVRVHSGAPLPLGADAVIMDEDVKVVGNKVYVYKPAPPGLNVIYRGEDFRKGEILSENGSIVSPPLIAALASIGISQVLVYRRVKVSVIAVGDELVEPGEVRVEGRSYNATAYIVYSLLVKDTIFEARYAGIVPDSLRDLRDAIEKEFDKGADIVITTGGTGVGESDLIHQLVESSERYLFRGVRMRPGRPTSSFILRGKVVLSLSGYPVAAWVGYEVLFRRAISRWLNLKGFDRNYVYARLTRRVPNAPGYTSVVRVSLRDVGGLFEAEPYVIRGSGVISSLLKTQGYIVIPENQEGYEKGELVRVYLYG